MDGLFFLSMYLYGHSLIGSFIACVMVLRCWIPILITNFVLNGFFFNYLLVYLVLVMKVGEKLIGIEIWPRFY